MNASMHSVQTPSATRLSAPTAAPPRWRVAGHTPARRGVGLTSLGLVLGALGGGLFGLVVAHLGGAAPDGVLAMVVGGAGEGALGGLFTGSIVVVSAMD